MTSIATLLSSVARPACRTAIYASVLALFGCASMAGVGGSAEFGCKAPVGVKCDSVSGTYYNALQQNLPSQQKSAPVAPDASAAPTLMDQLAGKRVTSAAYSGRGAAFVNTTVTALGATRDASAPLRSAPRVLRLWIKHWEDSDGDLHSQSYVYVPIDAGRWLIDHYRSPPRQAYAPIKAPRSVARAASTPGSAVTVDSQRTAQDETLVLGARARAIAPPSVPSEGDGDGQ
jgi:conjugal transfer pilus assembly protein TraV